MSTTFFLAARAPHLVLPLFHHMLLAHGKGWGQRLPGHGAALDVGSEALRALLPLLLFAATKVHTKELLTHGWEAWVRWSTW